MEPFWSADRDGPGEVLGKLVRRGWAGREGSSYALTADGDAAVARLGGEVAGIRRRASDGVSAEEYVATVDVLRRVAANLQRVSE